MKVMSKWLWVGLMALVTAGVFLLVAIQVNRVMDYPDFNVYWLAGRLVNEQASPYDPQAWAEGVKLIGWPQDRTFLYPLPAAIFFSPWARLPLRSAYTLWLFLSMALVVGAIVLTLASWPSKNARPYLIPVIAGLLVFRPLIVALRNGQIGPFLLFILVAAVLLIQKGAPLAGGLLVGLALLKPNLALAILLPVGLYFLLNRAWKGLLGMFLSGVFFVGVGWGIDSHWIQDFIGIGSDKLAISVNHSPNLWGAGAQVCAGNDPCAVGVGLTLSLLFLGSFLLLVWRSRPGIMETAALGVCVGLLITPFGWTYEHVLLALPVVWLVGLAAQKGPFLWVGLIPLGVSVLSIGTLFLASSIGNDTWQVLVPVLVFLGLSWMIGRGGRNPNKALG